MKRNKQNEKQLQENGQQASGLSLAEALELGKIAPWEFDPATGMFMFNEPWFKLWRVSPEAYDNYQMSAEHFAINFIHPEDAIKVGGNIQLALESDDPNFFHEEVSRVIFGDGEPGYVLLRFRVEKDSAGRTVKLLGTNQDVTAEKQAEAMIAKRAAELQTVAEISAAVTTIQDPQKLIEKVTSLTQRQFDLYHCHVFLLDEAGETLYVAACGWQADDPYEGSHGETTLHMDQEQSLVVQAARTRKAVVVNDVYGDPNWLPNEALPQTKSEMAVPLVAGEQVLGVLDVQSDQVGRFTEEDKSIMTTLAAQAAVALQNARHYKAMQSGQAELAEALKIAEMAHWEFDVATGAFLFNDAWYKMFRTSAEEQGGYVMPAERFVAQFVPPEARENSGAIIQAAIQSDDPDFFFEEETPAMFADGLPRTILLRIRLGRDADGRVVKMFGTNQDVTERRKAYEALADSQARLADALKMTKMGYWEYEVLRDTFVFDDQFYSLFNTTAAEQGGYEMSSGAYAEKFVNPNSAHLVGESVQKALTTDDPDFTTTVEAWHIRADGSPMYLRVQVWIEKDAEGRTVKMLGANQDITDRKLAEELIAKRAAELATVAQVSTAAAETLEPEAFLQNVVDLTKQGFDLYHAHIYLVDEKGEDLTLAAGSGEAGRMMTQEGWRIPLAREQSLVAQAARERRGVTVNDVTVEPGFMPNQYLPETRAELAVPLIVGDQVLGVLDVQSVNAGRFTEEDVRIQTTLAAQIAVALQNARSYAEMQASETLVRSIIDATPDWIFIKDRQHRYRMVNQGYANSMGRTTEEMVGLDDLDIGFPEDIIKGNPEKGIRGFWADDTEVMNRGEMKVVPSEPAEVGGEPRWLNTIKVPLKDANGYAWGVLGFVRDITERESLLEDVRQSQVFLSTMIDNIPNPVFYKDLEGRYLGCNQAFLDYLGTTRDEILGKSVYDLNTDRELADKYHAMDVELFEKSGVQVYEAQVKYADGSLHDVIFNKASLVDANGKVTGLVGTIVDITERKHAEALLTKRAGELETVAKVSTAVATVMESQEILQAVVDLTKESFELYHAHVYLVDESGEKLVLAAGAGEAGRAMVAQGWQIPLDSEKSLVAQAAREAKGVTVNDVTEAPDFLPNPLLPDTRSEMAVPMIVGDQVLGVLDVQSVRVGRFTEEDVRIKTTLAAQIAVALQNAREHGRVVESEKLVRTIIDATPDWIFIKDQDYRYRIVNKGYADALHIAPEEFIGKNDLELGFPEELVKGNPEKGIRGFWTDDRLVMDSGEPHFYPEDPATIDGKVHVFHTYKTPLRNESGEVWGVLAFSRDITERENLLEETERQARNMQNLNELGASLSVAKSLDEILTVGTRNVLNLVGGERASIALLKDDGETFDVHALGPDGKVFPMGQGLPGAGTGVAQCVKEGRVLLMPQDRPLESTQDGKLLAQEGLATTIFAPLGAAGKIIGALNIASTRLDAFDNVDRALMLQAAALVASSLESRMLFEQAEVHLNETKRSQAQLAEALKIAEMAHWEFDVATGTFVFNDAWFELFRTSVDEQGGYEMPAERFVGQFVPPETREHSGAIIQAAIQSDDPNFFFEEETSVVFGDGQPGVVLLRIRLGRDADGRVVTMYGTNQDITERQKAFAALARSQAQLAEALKMTKMGYWEYDVARDTFVFDDQFYSLFYTTAEEQGGYEMSSGVYAEKFVDPNSAHLVGESVQAALTTDDPDFTTTTEAWHKRVDGSPMYFRVQIWIVKDADGRTVRMLGANQDITERKLAEELVAKRAAELATVAQISTAVATLLNPQEILQTVVNLVRENFELYHAHIYLLDESGENLTLASGSGEVGQAMVQQGWEIPLSREKSLVAQAARLREGVTANNVQGEIGFMPNPLLPETAAEMAVPLLAGDRMLGVLDVQSAEVDAFTEEDIRIQTTLASQVAVALQNARTYEASQRQAAYEAMINSISQRIQTTTTVEQALQVAVRELGRALGATRTSVMLDLKHGADDGQSGNGQHAE